MSETHKYGSQFHETLRSGDPLLIELDGCWFEVTMHNVKRDGQGQSASPELFDRVDGALRKMLVSLRGLVRPWLDQE